jgi:hypothetical protein
MHLLVLAFAFILLSPHAQQAGARPELQTHTTINFHCAPWDGSALSIQTTVSMTGNTAQALTATVWGKGLRDLLRAGSRQLDLDQLYSDAGTGITTLCRSEAGKPRACTPVAGRLDIDAAMIEIGGALKGTLFYRMPGIAQELAIPFRGVIEDSRELCG